MTTETTTGASKPESASFIINAMFGDRLRLLKEGEAVVLRVFVQRTGGELTVFQPNIEQISYAPDNAPRSD